MKNNFNVELPMNHLPKTNLAFSGVKDVASQHDIKRDKIRRRLNHFYLILLALITAHSSAFAQTADPRRNTIQWNATGFTDQNTGATAQGETKFITYGSDKIEWVQRGGKLVYTLAVSSADGVWTNTSTDGSLIYHVVLNEKSGTITITRSSGAISLILHLYDGHETINNLYSITILDIL